MSEFFNVLPPAEALKTLLDQVSTVERIETIGTDQAISRTCANDVLAPFSLPTFRRSTMDGYAVRAGDTFGASDSLPALFNVVGEVPMGRVPRANPGPGEAVLIHTGGMLPPATDAVVQIENSQRVSDSIILLDEYEIEIFKSVAAGQNVIQIGEDIAEGDILLTAGHIIRAQDLGGLISLGLTTLAVRVQPRVAIIATGDEVVPAGKNLAPGQVYDINSHTVGALCEQSGGYAVPFGIIGDDFDELKDAAEEALSSCDAVVIIAGSSVSVRDMTAKVISQMGEPGILVHGIATKPGKPTILAVAGHKPVLGLPGNPVSAFVQFAKFGVPAVRKMLGQEPPPFAASVQARLSENLPSQSGREDYVAVSIAEDDEGLLAKPVLGKSNLIFTMIRADGLIRVPLNRGGLLAGDIVEVDLFRQ